MAEATVTSSRRIAIAAAIDVVAILLFVIIGRRSHDESGSAIAGTIAVAGPFLIGLAFGWLEAQAWKAPMSVANGMVIWLGTIIQGMVLRRFLFGDSTALPFIIVASLFTLLFLVGWRVVNEWLAGRCKKAL